MKLLNMKKLIYILLILLSYQTQKAQEKIKASFFETTFFESDKIAEKDNYKTLLTSEIEIKSPLLIKVNSEGKFLLDDSSKTFFGKIIKETEGRNNKNLDNNNVNLITDANQEFVDKIIIEKLADEISKILILNESFAYGDRNIDLYRDYSQLENKLIITKYLNSDIEIQVGNSLYPYLNKILKTEIDKTLQNSLNLLAINF